MNLNKKKEEFSKAYVHAFAAKSGWAVGTWSQDEFKIDTSLSKKVTTNGNSEVLHLDFQLKCTEAPTTDNDTFVSFTLRQEDYTEMSSRVGGKPYLLAVIIVPNEVSDWVQLIDAEANELHRSTKLKHCGYLAFISDQAGNYLGENRTIRFNKGEHEFNHEALDRIEALLTNPNYKVEALQRELERLTGANNE